MTMHGNKIVIIVTSAGTASAISVIKGLKNQSELNLHIVAVDLDPLAPGLFLADEFYIVPKATDSEYIPTLIEIAAKTGASILIPIYSKEIRIISAQSALLASNGIRTFISSPEVIDLCNDKIAMNKFAIEAGFDVPKLYESRDLLTYQESDFPLFAKPVTGSSSIGATRVNNKEELAPLLANKNLIIQEFIDADEVTVDVFCDIESNAVIVAPRLRLAVKSGQCVKGITLDNKLFIEPVRNFCKKLKMVGACNLQFFINKNNQISFIEINPRFAAGGLMLTIAAGANIPLALIKTVLEIPLLTSLETKPNISMTRYWNEIILDESNHII